MQIILNNCMGKLPNRLLYVSPVQLSSFAQRPHHFVKWYHDRTGGAVLWVDPGPSRLPRWTDIKRLKKIYKISNSNLGPTWQNDDWIQNVKACVVPFEPTSFGRSINEFLWKWPLREIKKFIDKDTLLVFGKPCALSIALAKLFPKNNLLFDAMDHLPGFCNGISKQWMLHAEKELAIRVQTLWVSSDALMNLHGEHAHKSHLVLNGLTPPTTSIRRVINEKPVLGYLGVIDHWFDWRRVISLAESRPWLEVQLVGPVHLAPPLVLPPNLTCRPAVPHSQIFDTLSQFDAGLIPFIDNDLTSFVDPVKYYEYRAVGLPVLSTSFGQMIGRGRSEGVWCWDATVQLGDEQLMAMLEDRPSLSQQQSFVELHNWTRRFDSVAHTISLKGVVSTP